MKCIQCGSDGCGVSVCRFSGMSTADALLRTKEIAHLALNEWAGWYDESRGGTPDKVAELRKELESLWPRDA